MRLIAIAAVSVCFLFASGCSKSKSTEWLPAEPMVSEGVLACEAMVSRFDQMSVDTATEEELVHAMTEARDSFGRCDTQFRSAGTTRGERALYAHRIDQVRLHELLFEATLSRRFDNMTGYCVILRDMVRVLAQSVADMEVVFESGKIKGEEERTLGELYQLDIRSLELLSVQLSVTCDGGPPPRAQPRQRTGAGTRGGAGSGTSAPN